MSEFTPISGEQEKIIKDMYNYHTLRFQSEVEKIIRKTRSTKTLQRIRKQLIIFQNQILDYRGVLPMRRNLGQHIAPHGNPKALTYTGIDTMLVRDGERAELLNLPGRSITEAVNSAYDTLEELEAYIPRAIRDVDAKLLHLRFSVDAPTPFREIGLLEDVLTAEQMIEFARVLDVQAGTIDLHQFRKKDAATILDAFRERMGFTIDKDCVMKYIHQGGISDWYGYGDGEGKRKRDQVRNIAGSSTTKPSDRIARWVKAVEDLGN